MPDRMPIREGVIVGAQPSEAELHEMAEEGVRSIVNLRTDGEEMQEMSPEQEGRKVREMGMEYLHIPVSMDDVGPETVDRFREELDRLPAPVFVHCRLGKRAGAFAMMDLGVRQGMTGDQVLEKAGNKGFECDKKDLIDFVKSYVDEHSG